MNRTKLLARIRRLRTQVAVVRELNHGYLDQIERYHEQNLGLRQHLEDNLTSFMAVAETFGKEANRYRRERDDAEARLGQQEARNEWLADRLRKADQLLEDQRRHISSLEDEAIYWQDKYLEVQGGHG